MLLAGVPLGLLAGILRGSPLVASGFGFAGLVELRDAVNDALWLTAGFVAIYSATDWILRRVRVPRRVSHLVAAAAACGPLFLALAYLVNIDREISPSTLFTRRGLTINIPLSVLMAALFPLIAFLLDRSNDRPVQPRHGFRIAALAAGALTVAMLNVGALARERDRPEPAGKPNVILIVIDSLRADHVGAYGYSRPTTPRVDAFAHDAVLFRQAIAQGTFTKTSMASLLTSKLPYQHGVYRMMQAEQWKRSMSDTLASRETTLAEILQLHGFLTEAWVRSTHLRPQWGFSQGFVTYDANQRSAGTINREFLSRLRRVGRRYPFFAYLHYPDVHAPYQPRPPYDRMFDDIRTSEPERLKGRYDGAIRQTDESLGRVFEALKAEKLYDDSLIIVTADHGEAFMEHGFLASANTPYDELVRVPLIVKLPDSHHRGMRIDRQVRQIDILPTVLDVMGIAEPSALEGCSLLALMDESSMNRSDIGCFAYAVTENADDSGMNVIAVRSDRYKYIRQNAREPVLYDLVADPGEHAGLQVKGTPIAQVLGRLASQVEQFRRVARYRHFLDPGAIRELKMLEDAQ